MGGDGSEEITGHYELLEDDQMRLDLTHPGVERISFVVENVLREDTLVLIAPDGDKTAMTWISRWNSGGDRLVLTSPDGETNTMRRTGH